MRLSPAGEAGLLHRRKLYYMVCLLALLFLAGKLISYINVDGVIRHWNDEQKRTSFEQLKRSAPCPEEMFQLNEEEPFLDLKDASEIVYKEDSLPHSFKIGNCQMHLHFEQDPRRHVPGKIVLKGKSIRLNSESYFSLLCGRFWKNQYGLLIKVRVSGRGRLGPYLYCLGDHVSNKKDRQITLSPVRISSFFPRDYYFVLPRNPDYERQSVGIQFYGNLNIAEITICSGTDRREKDISVVSAEVQKISEIPDPEKSSYPNCLFSLKMKTLKIEKGANIPQEFVLLAPAFRNRRKTPESLWKKGDIIHLSMIRFQEESEAIRQVQQADTIEDFDLERFSLVYAVQPRKFYQLKTGEIVTFGNRRKYRSGYERPQNPPLLPQEKTARKQRIAAQLNRVAAVMNTMRESPQQLNCRFEQVWKKNRKKYHLCTTRNQKKIYWCRKGQSYFALGDITLISTGKIDRTVLAVKDLSDYFLRHGISMIMVICPHYYDISARTMNPEFAKMPDYNSAYIAKRLLEQGVEALYVSDEILSHAYEYDLLYCYPDNPHPAYGTQQIIGRWLADYLKQSFPDLCRPKYTAEMFSKKKCDYSVDRHEIWNQWFSGRGPFFLQDILNGKPISSDPKSKIMLYGNSFLHTPEMIPNYTLASVLTRELKIGFYVLFREATHPLTTMILDLLEFPEKHLKGRKVCIFYYDSWFFMTTSPWNIREIDQLKKGKTASGKNAD